ncbi:MAG: hypothetical protein QW220_04200 [Candidatus Bathyarchaeia archaeon]
MNIRRVKEIGHQFRSSVSKPHLKRPRRKKEDAQYHIKGMVVEAYLRHKF